jgi:hypothetical protein
VCELYLTGVEYHTNPHPSHVHDLLSLHSGPLDFCASQPPQVSCVCDHIPITLPIPTLFTLTHTQSPRFLKLYLEEVYDFGEMYINSCLTCMMYNSLCVTQCVRVLDILKFHFCVLHYTDTISFPLFSSLFLSDTSQPSVCDPVSFFKSVSTILQSTS